ncbi:unnamed protein product, partial [marine sediment metagenome]
VDSFVVGSNPTVPTMKISIWIPKTKNPIWIQDFINGEITQAINIKSKSTRESVADGLHVAQRIARPGIGLYIEGKDFEEEKYDGKIFKYHCGRDFIKPEKPSDYT